MSGSAVHIRKAEVESKPSAKTPETQLSFVAVKSAHSDRTGSFGEHYYRCVCVRAYAATCIWANGRSIT